MKIFVIHYKVLSNRKRHILQQFKKYNLTDYEFIEIDRDELQNHSIDMFEKYYSKSQIAIALSHFYAYKEITEKYENALIFEDDVILSDHFIEKLNFYMNQLPQDYDMLFIGDGCHLHIDRNILVPNKYIYEKCRTRCTDSYIVSKKGALQICEYIKNLKYKINIPIDWWLNKPLQEQKLKIYWSEPTIVSQGTQTGLFQTSH